MDASPALKKSVAAYADQGGRYRTTCTDSPFRWAPTTEAEHHAIIEACRDRAQPAAVDRLAHHLSHTAPALITRMRPEHDPAALRTRCYLSPASATRHHPVSAQLTPCIQPCYDYWILLKRR
jgi:hypothetical protein